MSFETDFTIETNSPSDVSYGNNSISFACGAICDWFADPVSGTIAQSAPLVGRPAPGAFTLDVTVEPTFYAKYDAGALLLLWDETHWIKFAFEQSDQGVPTVVSVATRDRSDDCNGPSWPSASIRYRMSRRESAVGCYYHVAGGWSLHRLVPAPIVPDTVPIAALCVQSPTGNGTRAAFRDLRWNDRAVNDFRLGD